MDSIDGYLEESHQSTVLEVIQSFMTSKRYPPTSLLRTIMDNLLVSETKFTTPHKNASFCWFFVSYRNVWHFCSIKGVSESFITRG